MVRQGRRNRIGRSRFPAASRIRRRRHHRISSDRAGFNPFGGGCCGAGRRFPFPSFGSHARGRCGGRKRRRSLCGGDGESLFGRERFAGSLDAARLGPHAADGRTRPGRRRGTRPTNRTGGRRSGNAVRNRRIRPTAARSRAAGQTSRPQVQAGWHVDLPASPGDSRSQRRRRRARLGSPRRHWRPPRSAGGHTGRLPGCPCIVAGPRHQPMTMFDSITRRARSRSSPVSRM